MISEKFRGLDYNAIDAWPLDRVLAANDLIDEIARAESEAADTARREAQAQARSRRG